MTGDDYDFLLHCTIRHLHRVDGVEPDFEDGEKALNLLGPPGDGKVHILHIWHILHIDSVSVNRHILHESQPIYGF